MQADNAIFVPGDLDLDIQTHSRTYSTRIWCKSIQRFPEIFHKQTKKSQRVPKAQPYAVNCVW